MDPDYKSLLSGVATKIKSAQAKAALSENTQLIALYWDLGKMVIEKEANSSWGSKLIDQLAKDLNRELPGVSGFSRGNLYSIRQFYLFYRDAPLVQQAVGRLQNSLISSKYNQESE